MMGPHGFEKHSIVVAKLTNTVSRYPQEGTVNTLIGFAARRHGERQIRVLLNFDLILQVCYNACMRLK